MKAVRLLLVLALILLVGTTAFAARKIKDVNVPGDTYEWTDDDWTGETGCLLEMGVNWYIGADEDNYFTLEGVKDADPTIDQLVTNYSSADWWNDWHVQLINGTIQPGSVQVIKDGGVNPWWIELGADPGYDSGFTALAYPPAEWVGPTASLHVVFIYDPIDPLQRVTIKQWPTTELIPEPGSIATLCMGLATLGFALRRRAK